MKFLESTQKTLVIGIAGGSGSGKTTLAKCLADKFQEDGCSVLLQDSYYHDQSDKFDGDGGNVNFDHPSSLDFALLAEHLEDLRAGYEIQVPIYDFVTHTRSEEFSLFQPTRLVLLDGILILGQPEVCEQLDFSIFVDTPEKLRFERRVDRDVKERGREKEGVVLQYERQVLPMHNEFVEPSKGNADFVCKDFNREKLECLDPIVSKIETLMGR
jgi:uridine kinase